VLEGVFDVLASNAVSARRSMDLHTE
jgi:hypothetical protein